MSGCQERFRMSVEVLGVGLVEVVGLCLEEGEDVHARGGDRSERGGMGH